MEWLLNAKDRKSDDIPNISENGGGVRDINEAKCLLPLNGQIKFVTETEVE